METKAGPIYSSVGLTRAPEQIAGWLKAGNERGLRALGFEAIYAFIYRVATRARTSGAI
jgi:hypothetical protein